MIQQYDLICLFFFNDTATTEIYTLSLHDALPICQEVAQLVALGRPALRHERDLLRLARRRPAPLVQELRDRRSEEHTSELQSRQYLVCRLLLEKKKHSIRQSDLPPSLIYNTDHHA